MSPRVIAIAALAVTVMVLIGLFSSVNSGLFIDPTKWSSVEDLDRMEKAVPAHRVGLPSDGRHVYYILLFASAVLVLIDTLAYTKAIHDAGERASAQSKERRPRNMRSAALMIITCTAFFIVYWLLEIPLNPLGSVLGDLQHYLHEVIAILIFASFSVVDLLLWQSYRRESRSEENAPEARSEFKAHDREYLGQLLFVDLPVVVGLVFVVIVSLIYLGEVHSSFGNGFRAGAVIAHLAFSQFVFLALILHGRLLPSDSKGGVSHETGEQNTKVVSREAGLPAVQPVDGGL